MTTTAQQMVDFYMRAEVEVLQGKQIRHGERLLGMEDLAEIRRGRQEWETRLAQGSRPATGFSFSVARL